MKSYENIITNLFLLLTPAVLFGETPAMNPRSQGEGRKKTKRSSPKKQKKQPEKKRKHGENPCWQHHHPHKFITCIPWAETPASSTVLPSMPTRADLLPNSGRDEMKRNGIAHHDPSTHTHTADAALNLHWQQSGEWVWSQEPESKPLC